VRTPWRTASRDKLLNELERQQAEIERQRREIERERVERERVERERDRLRRERERLRRTMDRLEDELDAACRNPARRGVKFAVGTDFGVGFYERGIIDRDQVFLPDVVIEDFTQNVENIFRPMLDGLWQAAGFEGWPK
jgi:glutathione S-transferase